MEVAKNIGVTDVRTVAAWILQKFGEMSHIKLQKITFYCEAYHLAYFDNSLFPEEFEAWTHGPVNREIYHDLQGAGMYSDIMYTGTEKPEPDEKLKNLLTIDQYQLLIDVVGELSTWTAFQLESATHREKPWIEARGGCSPGDRCTNIISKETMRSFYKEESKQNGSTQA